MSKMTASCDEAIVSTFIHTLPYEILLITFRLVAWVPQDDPHSLVSSYSSPGLFHTKTTIQLGAVCSRWRYIIWQAPHLWTDCLLTLPNCPLNVTKLALKNTQGNPITALIDFNSRISSAKLRTILVEHRSHIQCLRISLSPWDARQEWVATAQFLDSPHSFPSLRELSINGDIGKGSIAWDHLRLFIQCDQPHQLAYVRPRNHFTPWHVANEWLTVLHICNVIPIDQCCRLLLHSPNLIQFRCVTPRPSSKLFEPASLLSPSSPPIFRDKLEVLEWGIYPRSGSDEWYLWLLSAFRFPSLRHLSWVANRPMASLSQTRPFFLGSSPGIQSISWTEGGIPWFLENLPELNTTVQTLRLKCTVAFPALFTHLSTPRLDGSPRFPNLKSLKLSFFTSNKQLLSESVLQFLSSRHQIPSSPFNKLVLESGIYGPIKFDEEQEVKLKFFRKAGIVLDLVEAEWGLPIVSGFVIG
ncbi:hypothetical protein D9756_009292 [Leucocoprinus leucothites]|uniref:F-box domain-containing protein n=1 Tax=Leucocoprinus leucothites TaxID=201217 RepID=A0A8H5CY35_9AGAR|nr:hypothetical protein D9756_009292 [Leucoagaricus leucothites]